VTTFGTTDIGDPCPRHVQLRLAGEARGEYQTALYGGQLGHKCLEILYDGFKATKILPDADEFEAAMAQATKIVVAMAEAERRPLSDSVVKNQKTIARDTLTLIVQYWERFAPRENEVVVGTECPVYLTIDVDGEEAVFTSHLDLLIQDTTTGSLRVEDWKFGDEAPCQSYLARNPQLGLYWLSVRYGQVGIPDALGEPVWTEFGEWPDVYWVHMKNLKPFARKTTIGDETFVKGDTRPRDRILMRVVHHEDGEAALRATIATRVRMMRAGLWPAMPDKQGCRFCDTRRACPECTAYGAH